MVVAGGGAGGGRYYAGAWRCGGVVYSDNLPFGGTQSIVIGAGGAAVSENVQGTSGADSSFAGVTAKGGGGGGSYSSTAPGVTGGSAGGSSGYVTGAPGRIAKTPQPVPGDWVAYGNNGGSGESPQNYGGGGGGGSGAVGYDGGEPGYPVAEVVMVVLVSFPCLPCPSNCTCYTSTYKTCMDCYCWSNWNICRWWRRW